jgi:hypothetical protein
MFTKSTANVSELHSNNITDGGSGSSRNARNVKILSLNRQIDLWTSLFISLQIHKFSVC